MTENAITLEEARRRANLSGDGHPKANRIEAALTVPPNANSISINGVSPQAPRPREFPNLDDAAYHGLAGEIVRSIDPHTESDPAGLLLHLHVAFGNVIGRGPDGRKGDAGPRFQVEGTRHGTNLSVVLVGDTSKARKGTGGNRVLEVMRLVDDEWCSKCNHSGLSSGEGVIHAVRDPATKWNSETGGLDVIEPGADDKRLMVVEPEFAGALKIAEREGNILSRVLRDAWDGDRPLATLTKNSPTRASNATISLVGHVTSHEFRARLTRTEMTNGFANRLLIAAVRRSKKLPFGGSPDGSAMEAFAKRIMETVCLARTRGEIRMDEEARETWIEAYEELSADRPGMLGALTARAEAQAVRLALIYALWDGSAEIRLEHLIAALALWRYCQDSVAYIFGDALGDPVADAILGGLKIAGEKGMTRAEISGLFSRNVEAAAIGIGLEELQRRGLAVRCEASRLQGERGRPPEIWRLAPGVAV